MVVARLGPRGLLAGILALQLTIVVGLPASATDEEPAKLGSDLSLIAESNGWTLDQARMDQRKTVVVGEIAEEIAKKQPGKFVGGAVGDEPEDAPRIFVKGETTDLIDRLVNDAPIEILVVDHQPYSFDEIEERMSRVQRAVSETGVTDFTIGSGILEGAGRIPVTVRDGASTPSEDELRAAIPADLRDDVTFSFKQGGDWQPDSARGGMKTTSSWTNHFCTAGFTANRGGTLGVVGAAHCHDSLNRISVADHTMNRLDEHYGNYGDLEFYSTDTNELPEFYAETYEVRSVLSEEPRSSILFDEQVCAFGRGSLYRACNEVEDATATCGSSLERMVEMNADSMNDGDSGGPWFRDNRAFGIHHGPCGDGDLFTPTDNTSNVLGADILID